MPCWPVQHSHSVADERKGYMKGSAPLWLITKAQYNYGRHDREKPKGEKARPYPNSHWATVWETVLFDWPTRREERRREPARGRAPQHLCVCLPTAPRATCASSGRQMRASQRAWAVGTRAPTCECQFPGWHPSKPRAEKCAPSVSPRRIFMGSSSGTREEWSSGKVGLAGRGRDFLVR